ncbi:hypothetical protein D3C84_740280 [compost metagenome]
MIDTGVKPQLVDHVLAFLAATRDADDTQALDLRHLADHRAHRTRGRRDHQGLPGLGLANVHQPHVSGHAWHAQHTQGHRRAGQPRGDGHHVAPVADAVALPTGGPHHQITLLEFRVHRAFHAADGTAGHDLVDFYRSSVGRRVTHSPAHVGVQGQEQCLEQNLSFRQIRQCHVFKTKIFRRGRPLGAGGQDDALTGNR